MVLFLFLLVIFILLYSSQITNEKTAKQIERKSEEEELKAYNERFDAFCNEHSNIKPLAENAHRILNSFVRNNMMATMYNPRPMPPTYTTGLYKGSIGDNISVISNAQKKEQYEQKLAAYNEWESKKSEYRIKARKDGRDYIAANEKLVTALKEIPGSEEFVASELKCLEKVKSSM